MRGSLNTQGSVSGHSLVVFKIVLCSPSFHDSLSLPSGPLSSSFPLAHLPPCLSPTSLLLPSRPPPSFFPLALFRGVEGIVLLGVHQSVPVATVSATLLECTPTLQLVITLSEHVYLLADSIISA